MYRFRIILVQYSCKSLKDLTNLQEHMREKNLTKDILIGDQIISKQMNLQHESGHISDDPSN